MQRPYQPEYTEAARPFDLPEAFHDTHVSFTAQALRSPHTANDCRLKGHPSCAAAPVTSLRIDWKLTDAAGETLRENTLLIRCLFVDETALMVVAGFAAWYSMLREVTAQNDVRFHPPSEIPITLTQSTGEITKTPPHFFNS